MCLNLSCLWSMSEIDFPLRPELCGADPHNFCQLQRLPQQSISPLCSVSCFSSFIFWISCVNYGRWSEQMMSKYLAGKPHSSLHSALSLQKYTVSEESDPETIVICAVVLHSVRPRPTISQQGRIFQAARDRQPSERLVSSSSGLAPSPCPLS